MSWRLAVASVITITPSLWSVSRAGRSLGMRIGMVSRFSVEDDGEKVDEVGLRLDSRHVLHSEGVAEIPGDLAIERDAVKEQLLESPYGESIGIDIIVVYDPVQHLVLGPFGIEEG